jgi:hypothetical protein
MVKYILLCLFVLCSLQNTYASDWIAYRNQISTTTQVVRSESATHYTQPSIPYYINPNPVIVYNSIPVYSYQPVIINRTGLFCHRSEIVQIPVVSWIYQPTIIWNNLYR